MFKAMFRPHGLAGLSFLALGCLVIAQPARADRIGTIGDWQTSTDSDHMPYAKLRQPQDHPLRDFSMHCGASGKIEFSLNDYRSASGGVPASLIADDEKQETFRLELFMGDQVTVKGSEADRLLTNLLRQESAARAAGAKSCTFTFFINDPKTPGYSVNIGGIQQVHDFLVKHCAERPGTLEAAIPKPTPQNDKELVAQPFVWPDRVHFMMFSSDGTYQIVNHRSGQVEWRGFYTVGGGTLVLDPNLPQKMVCGFKYDVRKNVALSNCEYAGLFVALNNFH